MKPTKSTPHFVFCSGSMNFFTGAPNRRFISVNLPSSRSKSAIVSRMSREPEFSGFLASIGCNAVNQEEITAAICEICEVDSRADLDRDQGAVARFEARIGTPYAAYRRRIRFGETQ